MKTTYLLLSLIVFVLAGCGGPAPLATPGAVPRPAPPFTYAFDDSFLHYFGHEGTMHAHSAVQRALNKGFVNPAAILRELEGDAALQVDLQSHREGPFFQLLPEFNQ